MDQKSENIDFRAAEGFSDFFMVCSMIIRVKKPFAIVVALPMMFYVVFSLNFIVNFTIIIIVQIHDSALPTFCLLVFGEKIEWFREKPGRGLKVQCLVHILA